MQLIHILTLIWAHTAHFVSYNPMVLSWDGCWGPRIGVPCSCRCFSLHMEECRPAGCAADPLDSARCSRPAWSPLFIGARPCSLLMRVSAHASVSSVLLLSLYSLLMKVASTAGCTMMHSIQWTLQGSCECGWKTWRSILWQLLRA